MYGLDVLGYTELDARDRADPMAVVFPKVLYGSYSWVQCMVLT